jgi:hypothetical protein
MKNEYLSIIAFIVIGCMVLALFLPAVFAQTGIPWKSGLLLPLKQFKSGVRAQDVKCQPYYFILVIKAGDNSPACVKPETASILIERGWAREIVTDTSTNLPTNDAPTTANTGIIVPLYSYPYLDNGAFYWKTINDTKNKYPHIPFFVIINPNNGFVNGCIPNGVNFTAQDLANYQRATANLTKSGIVVLGYVATGWGANSLSWVEYQIKNYTSCMPTVTGILLDEMQSHSGKESYYQTLTDYIHNIGLRYSIGNPGEDIASSYVGTVDILNVAETNSLYPDNGTKHSGLSGTNYWHLNFPKDKFSMVVLGINALSSVSSKIKGSTMYVGLIFITNDTDSNYGPILSYLDAEVGNLNFGSSLISIKSVNSDGKKVTGLYIQVNQSSNQIPSGYTTLDYNATTGVKYLFTPQSNHNCLFDHWQDTGSMTVSRMMMANTTNAAFTAVYKDNGTHKCNNTLGN